MTLIVLNVVPIVLVTTGIVGLLSWAIRTQVDHGLETALVRDPPKPVPRLPRGPVLNSPYVPMTRPGVRGGVQVLERAGGLG